ncbi:hypothetical protein K438DRAFT_539121 [Mycena galopus ATCC 62051]|nr:hypothetical protein K438DRAFT_539121 [Mycena galopus ATCC 62051]
MQLSLGQAQPRSSTPSSSRPIPGPSLRLPAAITSVGRLRTLSPSPESPSFLPCPPSPPPVHPFQRWPPVSSSSWRHQRFTPTPDHYAIKCRLDGDGIIAKYVPRQEQRPLKTVKHLMVVYWDEDNKPHAVFYIHLFLTWPMWQVAHATSHFATLLGDNPDVEVYDPSFKTWASIGSTYPHPIIADKALLLRRRNTQCLKLDEVVHTFYPPEAVHPCTFVKIFLQNERRSVRIQKPSLPQAHRH